MKKIIVVILCFALFLAGMQVWEKTTCDCITWQEISSFSTSFQSSVWQRKENIRLSASKFEGVILKSGEKISFNKVVGNRTEENGYKKAIVIENGVYTGGVGGGVCQTSTTIYNAALRGGLKILEVHPHSLSPEYVDASFDAMVSNDGSDLVFSNIYPYPVKISAKTENDKLTVKIYAPKKIQGLEIAVYSNILKKIAPPETIEKLDTDFPEVEVAIGDKIAYRNPKEGKVSKGYIMYKYNGKIIRIKQIRSDLYIPMQGIIIMGTKKA